MSINKISLKSFKDKNSKVFEDTKNKLFLIDNGLSIMVSKSMV